MNILHVIPAVAERYGGPSQAVVGMCRALATRNVNLVVATTNANGPHQLHVPLAQTVEHDGVPMIFFRRQWSEAFKYSRPLARWLMDHAGRFDLVHIHAVFSHASLAAARAARRAKVPYIIRPLGSLAPWALLHRSWRKRMLWRLGVESMLRNASAIHCTSDSEVRQVRHKLGTCNAVMVPLGVDIPPLEPAETDEQHFISNTWRPYVLALGRLHPVKGLEMLIRSFLDVVRKHRLENWRLVIAGDGEPSYASSLRRLVESRGGNGNVIFPGWLEGAAKESALRHAAIVAVPSHQESFGMTVFEAMGRGVPVAVSGNIDVARMVEHERVGWTFDLDESSMRSVLVGAFADEPERARRGERGRLLVETHFTWPIVAGQLRELYRDVCGHD